METNKYLSVLFDGSFFPQSDNNVSDQVPSLLQDFKHYLATSAIKGFDVLHQIFRLRHTKNMLDTEVELIMRAIADNVQSYDQVVEVGDISYFR